jgi:hypothetical protein
MFGGCVFPVVIVVFVVGRLLLLLLLLLLFFFFEKKITFSSYRFVYCRRVVGLSGCCCSQFSSYFFCLRNSRTRNDRPLGSGFKRGVHKLDNVDYSCAAGCVVVERQRRFQRLELVGVDAARWLRQQHRSRFRDAVSILWRTLRSHQVHADGRAVGESVGARLVERRVRRRRSSKPLAQRRRVDKCNCGQSRLLLLAASCSFFAFSLFLLF